MKNFKRFLLFLVVLIAIVLIAALFLPSTKLIEDSVVINTPADMIFKKVNNLKAWEQWSPFQKEDKDMISEYTGAEEGVGAVQTWKSKVNGDGSMTIEESSPYSVINMKLDLNGMSSGSSNWKFEPEGKATKVTWSVEMKDLGYPMGRIFGLFMPKMMHKAFQGGLEDLKKLCEGEFAKMMVYKTGEITVKEMEGWKALAIKDSSTCDKVGDIMGIIFPEVQKYIADNKFECVGPPYAKYYLWDEKANKFVLEAGLPVKSKVAGKDRIFYVEYPKMKVATASHFGAYETLYFTYQEVEKYIKDNNLKQKGDPWEVYITDPEKEPDMSKWETQVFYPVE
jgi:effector-binding domain-containing protein